MPIDAGCFLVPLSGGTRIQTLCTAKLQLREQFTLQELEDGSRWPYNMLEADMATSFHKLLSQELVASKVSPLP